MPKTKPRKKYTPEFKAQMLKEVSAGSPISAVAEKHGLRPELLYNWRATTKKRRTTRVTTGRSPVRHTTTKAKTNGLMISIDPTFLDTTLREIVREELREMLTAGAQARR